ncbi:MAG: hypothetical protein U5N55_11715 [Cypionkella sp.]|nr:hypothetical protein [Cypionkella sp.]
MSRIGPSGLDVVNYGLDASAGAVFLTDFNISNATAFNIRLAGGQLTMAKGHVLRGATGISQTGGTLILDAARPINVFGNATQFIGGFRT